MNFMMLYVNLHIPHLYQWQKMIDLTYKAKKILKKALYLFCLNLLQYLLTF